MSSVVGYQIIFRISFLTKYPKLLVYVAKILDQC